MCKAFSLNFMLNFFLQNPYSHLAELVDEVGFDRLGKPINAHEVQSMPFKVS